MVRGLIVERQAATDSRLGELLVRTGAIDASELRAVQSLQTELRAVHGETFIEILRQRFRLGRLLVDSGVIDEDTLQHALAQSRRTGQRLGESLVDAGAISSEVLHRFLHRQRKLTMVALSSAALSTLSAPPAAANDTAQVRVVATVLARASIDAQRLPTDVAISDEDIQRGYIDLQEPVEVDVRSNHPGGVKLGFAVNSRQLAAVDVQGGTAASVHVPQREPGLQRQTVSFKLRLKLAPGAVPGRIAFPVTIFLTPA